MLVLPKAKVLDAVLPGHPARQQAGPTEEAAQVEVARDRHQVEVDLARDLHQVEVDLARDSHQEAPQDTLLGGLLLLRPNSNQELNCSVCYHKLFS
jgi:hypothetical protein